MKGVSEKVGDVFPYVGRKRRSLTNNLILNRPLPEKSFGEAVPHVCHPRAHIIRQTEENE